MSISKLATALVLSGPLMLALPAFAEPELKPFQEEAKAAFDEASEQPLKDANAACGTTISLKSEYENFKAEPWQGMAHYSWCVPVLEAIKAMCESRPAYKKALAKKLKSVACVFSGVKPAEKSDGSNEGTLRNMSMAKGVFTFNMSPQSANVSDNAKATLEKALNE
jgi:hypothetical protein